jgi:glycosyltransferase involved in cell wall biosynthesis
MRIVHLLHGFRPEFTGGVERYVESLAGFQRVGGDDVHVVAGCGKSADQPSLQEHSVDGLHVVRVVRSDLFLDQWFDAYSPAVESMIDGLLAKVRPDVVHVHHWKRLTSNLVQIAARRGVPAVVTLHDLWTTCPREYRLLGNESCARPLGAASCARCARLHFFQSVDEVGTQSDLFRETVLRELHSARAVLVPSKHHADAVAQHLGISPDRFEVLGLGRLGGEPASCAEASVRFPSGPLRVGFWGHLVDFKGAHLLLEALGHVRSLDRFDVHVFGTEVAGTYRARLDRLADGKPVTFHGAFRPADVAATPLDVAVVPSICHESYSFVLEEALTFGLPVIVSDRGALPERAGRAGLVFRAPDARQLAEKLQSLVDDPSLLAQLREEIPTDDRSIAWHARAVAAVYSRAVAAGPPPAVAESEHRALAAQLAADRDRRIRLLIEMREKAERADHYEGNLLRHRELLKDRERELAAHRKALEDVRTDLDSHRKVLEAREAECASLREVLATVQEDLAGHRAVLGERERECRERREIQESLDRELEAHRRVGEAHDRELAALRSTLDAVTRDLEGHRAVLADREKRLAEALSVVKTLESDLVGHRGVLELRARDVAERDAEVARLRAEVAELTAALDRVRSTLAYRFARAVTGSRVDRPEGAPRKASSEHR